MEKGDSTEHAKLQNVVINSLMSNPSLVQKQSIMDFELFNYLVKSLSSTDKNITFDPNTSSTISVDMLSDRIRKIDPHADLDELQNLFEGRRDITAEELFHLFNDQRQVQLEPMKQSYAIFDEDGYLSETKLRKLMDDMGFEPLRPKDMAIMMESFDNDGDRRVSRKDFETVIEIAVQRCHPPK